MDPVQYYANLRQLNKMEMLLRELDIQIQELEESKGWDTNLKQLLLEEKRIKKAIDKHHYEKLKEQTVKSVGDGVGDGSLKANH